MYRKSSASLQNLSRYSNGGTDRPFWLEAYNGGPYQVDRQKYPVPLFIPHLTLPAFGTIQPDRLADMARAHRTEHRLLGGMNV